MHILLGVTHLDDATHHGAEEGTIMYLIKNSDYFLKTIENILYFHGPTFYNFGKNLFREVRVLNNIRPVVEKESFDECMQRKISMSKLVTSGVYTMVYNTLHVLTMETTVETSVHP